MMKRLMVQACCIALFCQYGRAQVYLAGTAPGKAIITCKAGQVVAQNNVLGIQWMQQGNTFTGAVFTDKQQHRSIRFDGSPLFRLVLKNGQTLGSDAFQLKEAPRVAAVKARPGAVKAAGQLNGQQVSAVFVHPGYGITLRWTALLRDGTNYIRQCFRFSAKDSVAIDRLVLVNLPAGVPATAAGKVDGSPVVSDDLFFGIEHPLSETATAEGQTSCFLSRQSPITATDSFVVSSVWGVAPKGQLRRGFLYYVEKERAVPYRPFLHYNSWFDISWADRKLTEDSCLDRIQTFADSLIVKRKTPMKAFLFDDGWDDNQTLWQFNKGFPNGFTPLKTLAARYHSRLGVWISPWGGYDEAKQQRLRYGRLQNPPFEINGDGFSLAGPHYYQRFKSVAERFVTDYGVAIFKYDGIGSIDGANGTTNGSSGGKVVFRKDFEAMLSLVKDLRGIRPDLYFSLTIGTWPSPYWLQYADNIWRSGWDNGQAGEGPKRQQWLNFRDGNIYQNIVQRAPLYPLNAVMNHGICIAGNGLPGTYEMDEKNIADEIWSFFATGTSLQEMYINPHKLSAGDWDCLARAIQWSHAHAAVLPDVHWVGGNPGQGEVYGFAAWNPGGAVLSLRNPSAVEKTFTVNSDMVFDLPAAYKGKPFAFYAVNKGIQRKLVGKGRPFTVTLAPFEVLVMDGVMEDKPNNQ